MVLQVLAECAAHPGDAGRVQGADLGQVRAHCAGECRVGIFWAGGSIKSVCVCCLKEVYKALLADAQTSVEAIVTEQEDADRAETSVLFDLCVLAELGKLIFE